MVQNPPKYDDVICEQPLKLLSIFAFLSLPSDIVAIKAKLPLEQILVELHLNGEAQRSIHQSTTGAITNSLKKVKLELLLLLYANIPLLKFLADKSDLFNWQQSL